MLIIFLGAPGSGKGTVADRMVKNHGYKHISTGDIFRRIIAEETELGLKVKDLIEGGNLVDDATTWEVAKVALEEVDLANEKVIIDGYPRNIHQAELLDAYLQEKGLPKSKPLYFEVEENELITRLSSRIMCKQCGKSYNKISMPTKVEGICDECGGEIYQREDDKPENIQVRLATYKEVTEPLIKCYADNGTLILINGEASSEVTTEISLKFSEGENS